MTPSTPHPARRPIFLLFIFLGIALMLLAGCSGGSAALSPTAVSTSPTAASTASGTPAAEWASLEGKPLHLPMLSPGAACPVTPAQQHVAPDHQYAFGSGPVYLVAEALQPTVTFLDAGSSDPGSAWKISKVFWEVAAAYAGPAIIRGGQIDGTHQVGFNGGLGQTAGNTQGTEPILRDLRLLGDPAGQWKTYLTFARIQSPGCYAFQIDGPGFSSIIVVQATVQ
jgi:hypothetical protein